MSLAEPSSSGDPSIPPPARVEQGPNRGLLAYATALLALFLDQTSKFWILSILDLPERGTVPLLPVLNLTMVWNPGVSFGLLRSEGLVGRLLLAGFATCVVVGLGWYVRKTTKPLMAIGIGLVMGGAVGNNLIDRLRFGRVADFIDISGTHVFPWVFNVADSAITIGVALLILDSFLPSQKLSVEGPAT